MLTYFCLYILYSSILLFKKQIRIQICKLGNASNAHDVYMSRHANEEMLAGNADPDASYSDADSMLLNLNTNNAKNSLVIFCFVLKLFLIITAVKWLRFIAYTDADLSIRIIFFCCLK